MPTKITSISVSGFKAIDEEQSIKFTPLTILSGCNSGGKSSFFQPLLLIKQTLESPFDPGAILINGAHVKFNDISQMLSDTTEHGRTSSFYIRAQNDDNLDIKIVFKKSRNIGFKIDYIYVISEHFPDGFKVKEGSINVNDLPDDLVEFTKVFNEDFKWVVKRNKCFLEISAQRSSKSKSSFSAGIKPCIPIEILAKNIIHLPGLRGNPERTYEKSSIGSQFPGTFDKYTASVIDSWKNTKKGKLNIQKLEEYLHDLGLTNKIDTKKIDDANVEIRVSRMPIETKSHKKSDFVSIADVGLGVSQALPVLTSLLAAKKDQLVYLEQPEIHLHPKAQCQLVKPLIDASKRGVIVIIETHSSLLLRSIQTAVAKNEVNSNDVSLHWFSRNPDTGSTSIKSVIVDEFGAFGDWPENFDEVAMNVEQSYLDAVEMKYEGS